jgi:signal transduction histidine kinase
MIKFMNASQERILIVESNPEISDLIGRQTLQPLGYHVDVISASADALQKVTQLTPDVIIADLNLPGLSGKDLLVALSSQGVDAPIIVIAPKGMEGDVIQAFRLGAADFLSWPVREAEVVSAVERLLKLVRSRGERESLARQLKQTNQELQRRVRELTTIFAIGKAVISTNDQQTLFDKIVEGGVFITESDTGWLLVREDRTKSFLLRAHRNLPKEFAARVDQPWDDGVSSLVALSGESLTMHGEPLKRFKIAKMGQAILVVPVKVKKEIIGLLVMARQNLQPFSTSQQALLEAVADYASISLVNARLFHALQERVISLQQKVDNSQAGEHIQGEVLQSVCNELNTSLGLIQTQIASFLKQNNQLSSEQLSTLEAIQTQVHGMLDVISSSKNLTGGPHNHQFVVVDMVNLVREAISRYQPLVRKIGTTFYTDLPSSPVMVQADPAQIARVLDGLLSNAVKFSSAGSHITLGLEVENNQTAHLTIRDQGIGINLKHLNRIFEPQVAKSRQQIPSRYSGIGIPLYLIRDIVRAHGGKIWVESQTGKGSTFHFTLPPVNS